MNAQVTHSLDYASATTKTAGRPFFKTVLFSLAACGAVANTWFVYLAVKSLHRAHWAYRDLIQDPRVYGREVARETIEALGAPYLFWSAAAAFILASSFGLLLAVRLLSLVWQVESSPEVASEGLRQYRRLKPFGTTATAVALFWFLSAEQAFWIAATRHVPVGSLPPFIETTVLAICAMAPAWWIGKQSHTPQTARLPDEVAHAVQEHPPTSAIT